MSVFKYDIVTFIELIKSKPCLWDKKNEYYKHKGYREKSWQDIFEALEEGYDGMSQTEKKRTGDLMTAKWTNLRDAFLRSLKPKHGHEKKPYKYGEHLQFLLNMTKKESTKIHSTHSTASAEDDSGEFDEVAETQALPQQPLMKYSASTQDENPRKAKRRAEDLECMIEPYAGNTSSSHKPLSDLEILLLSFLPYIRDLKLTELLDFQMEVLTIIKKIKDRRKNMPEG